MKPLRPIDVPLDGAALIEASAGTGKTFTITTLFVRLLLEQERRVSDILVVTFTRAATAELRDRIRRRIAEAAAALLPDADPDDLDDALAELVVRRRGGAPHKDRERLLDALRGFDEAAIFTIHGFCQRVLAERAFESGAAFEADFIEDQTPLLEQVVQDYWARQMYGAHASFVDYVRRQSGGKPEELRSLAHRAAADPEMPILPSSAQPPAEDLFALAARWDEARDAVVECWNADRPAIEALWSSAVFNQSSYSDNRRTREWPILLDGLHAARPPCLPPKSFPLLTRTGAKTKGKGAVPDHRFFDLCEVLWGVDGSIRDTVKQGFLVFRCGLVDYAREQLAARKRLLGKRSFDDLLHDLDRALRGTSGERLARAVRQSYPAALIDEFQDTDPTQYRIFDRIYSEAGTLFLIGDPKQAIYAFRGADVFSYMAAKDARESNAHTLLTNYRSDPLLIQGVNSIFDRRLPFYFDRIGFDRASPSPGATRRLVGEDAPAHALQLAFMARGPDEEPIGRNDRTRRDVARFTASHISKLLHDQVFVESADGSSCRVEPRHIAILCRTNKEAHMAHAALRELRIPAVVEGDSSVFDTPMAAEVERVLRALAQPANAGHVRSAITTTVLGVSGNELHEMQDDEGSQHLQWDLWLSRFHEWSRLWYERSFVEALSRVMDAENVRSRLLARSDGERRLTNLLHLVELLHSASQQLHLGPLALLHWFVEMRGDEEKRLGMAGESAQVRLESDEHAVRLTTVHRSKGLEYPIVYCPFLWAGLLLHPSDRREIRFHDDQDRMWLDVGGADFKAHIERAEAEAFAENLRLLYVALTRARHHTVVVWGRFNQCEKSALGYLLHQPPGPFESEEVLRKAVEARIKGKAAAKRKDAAPAVSGLSDLQMRQDISELAASCDEGAMGLFDLRIEAGQDYRASLDVPPALAALERSRKLNRSYRTSSFSRLTAGADHHVSLPAEEGVDHDEGVEAVAPEPRGEGRRVVLHDFPAGTGPGIMIHHVFEHLDFQADDADLRTQVDKSLKRFGLGAGLNEALSAAVRQVLGTDLDGAGLKLVDVTRADRLDELEFLLPVADERNPMSRSALADVLAAHGGPTADPAYVERVRGLDFAPLSGFLKGLIDLCFRSDGRWYVVDYKSNLLGKQAEDYGPESLSPAMSAHHYYLQYLFYTVALNRYLTARLGSDYEYERDFGGVFYLFLRGMSPNHPPGTGVFSDRPALALIEALSALLGEGRVAA